MCGGKEWVRGRVDLEEGRGQRFSLPLRFILLTLVLNLLQGYTFPFLNE